MDIQNYVPTDSLYKFLAIFGLIIMVFSLVFPYRIANECGLKAIEISGELKILDLEIGSLKEDIAKFKEAVQGTMQDIIKIEKNRKLTKIEKDTIRTEALKKKDILAQKREKLLRIAIKNEELNNNNNKILYLLNQVRQYRIIFNFAAFSGFLMTILGFYFWYHRLQKYQDAVIKKKSEEQ